MLAEKPVLADDPMKAKFKQATDNLWRSEVCPALIFDRQLSLCSECLAIFHADDNLAVHPPAAAQQISKLCFGQGISTQDIFFSAMWSIAVNLAPVFGQILMPRMSREHREPPKTKEKIKDSMDAWNNSRIHILEEELLRMQSLNARLEQDLMALQDQSASLLSLYIAESSKNKELRLQVWSNLKTLTQLMTPDDSTAVPVYRRPATTS